MSLSVSTEELRQAGAALHAGQEILLSGTVYTARDAAHKRLLALLQAGEPLPFPIADAVIYYAGPTPAPKGLPIGACGPTTSSRMDPYTPRLLDLGLAGMIGKGPRNASVCEAIRRTGGIYLCAIGGAGALAAQAVQSLEVVAFPELGCESVKRLTIRNFPLIVAIDRHGANLFSPS